MHNYWTLEPKYKTFDDKIRETKCKPLKEYYYRCSRNLNYNTYECESRLNDYQMCRDVYVKIKDK